MRIGVLDSTLSSNSSGISKAESQFPLCIPELAAAAENLSSNEDRPRFAENAVAFSRKQGQRHELSIMRLKLSMYLLSQSVRWPNAQFRA